MGEYIKGLILVLIGVNIGVVFTCIVHIHFMKKSSDKKAIEEKEETTQEEQS